MQRMAKTLLFFYPAVRWLSNRLRHEREFRCNELAAEADGNRRTHASALGYTGRAELASKRPVLAVGFGHYKMAILARVRHVLGISSPPKRSRCWLAGVLTPATVIMLGIVAQVAVTGSDAKAKTISESARQTAVRSADIDTIKKLAVQLANRDEWYTALASAKALIEQQPAVEMHVFEPLFEPLFSKVGWGGVIRRESRTAADLLARIGKPAVGFLLEKLKSTEARQRWSAIQILTEIGEPDAPVVSAIRLLLSDKDDYVRRVAIENLGKLGENARPAAEDLKAAFNDASVINQIFARATYIRIGHSKPEHIRAIAKYLKSPDTKDEVGGGSAAAVAASVLGDLGPVAIIAAPDLIAALNHPHSQVRLNAAHALGRIGADSNQAIEALIYLLKNDTSREVRRSAGTSLGRIGPKAQGAIPFLAKVLREADKESRNDPKTDRTGWWVAARAVGQIGGANAIAVLEESLKNNDPDIRSTAAKALQKIQQDANTPPTPPSTQPAEKISEPALTNTAAKAMEPLPAQNSFQGITVSIKAKKSVYEPGSIFEIVGTISTDREHTMYNAYWDLKKPVPGRLFVYDEAGNQILEFYDPRHHIGSSTGATKSACRKYKPGETQQIFLRQCLLFDRSADRPLPPGRYKVQLALNGLLLWEPREYVAHDEVPQELDRQMVAYSNVVHIEIKGEPVFQPKTLTQWIEALKHDSPKVRYSAAWTLREMKDPRAVAPLIESLKDEDHKIRYLSTEALAAIGKPAVDSLIVALKEKDTQVRICAAKALERIADKRSMAPLIVALKEDQNREVRSSAARALGNIRDKNAVPVLIEALRDKDIHPQITVCGALRKIGKPAIDGLIFHLKDTDNQARIRVAKALAEIADKRSTEALVGALRDENPEVRSLAAHGLGRIKARSAVPALIEALKADEVPSVRSSAARALGQTKGPGAVAALTAALKDKDVARSAWWALAEIGKPAVEHLIIALKDTDLQVRLSAAKALASIVDKKSLEPLIDALRDENAEVRVLAAETLGKLEDKRAVMPLTARLNDKDVRVRKGVILALGKIKDDRAVEPIIAILRDEMPSIRSCAARGLGMIRDKRAVEPLIPLLKDSKDNGAAYYTAWALGEIGDKRAVEPLITCLNHESQHSSVLGKAAEALGKIKDERAVEPLMTALKVTRPSIHMPRSLDNSWAKPTDEAYLSYLIMILEDDYEARQYAVAWALVQLGQPAIGPLTGALQSDDKWLSGAAAVILEKIQASPATELSTGMQFRQGKVEKQLAWLASEADVVVVAENPWQYDRLYARQVLKGSKVSFSNIQEIDGIEKPPTDKNKQWILFLRIEQDHNLLLSPVTPSGWFAPYSEELAQRVVAAIPQPETWGETRDGLRLGLRLRKSDFDVGEEIPVEICIQNVSKKAVTLYQHRYNNREYDYYPFTRLVVEFSDGRRLELYKPTLCMSDLDSPSPRTLLPGETYIHTVNLNKWTDWYEPAPKPGEKVELFTPGTFKITCTYSVGKKPPMVPEPAQPKNAWSGTLTSAPITLKIIEAKDASAATQPTVTERYVLNDMPADVRKEIEKLHSPDARIRALAAMALGEMGPRAGPAIPHLIRLLGDRAKFDHRDVWQKATFFTIGGRSFGAYVAAEATGALAKVGEPAVKPLIEALKDSNAFVRVHAARALERIQDKHAVEPLCDVLKDADENVRSAAAIALGQIGDGRAAKQLTELLGDKAFRPRQDAIDALIKLDRPATKPVLTALRDWRRRGSASYVLAKTRDPHAVEPLLEDLKDPNHNVRYGAVLGLGALGDRRAVKPLVKLLKDPNPHVRAASVRALGLIGEIPLEVYKTALQDEEPQVRINVAMALRRTKNANTTEILVKALKDTHSSVRNGALLAFSEIRDFRAVPAIIELLRDEDEGIRTNAAFVLAQFKDQRAVKPLIEALKDKNYEVRARASYALGEIKDPRAVDVLCKALGDEKPEVRVRAAMALRNIGDKRAVGPLIKALKDPDWEVVIRTAEALGKIGDAQAVEPLISILTDELKSSRKINIVRDYVRESTDDLPWAGTDMTVALPVIAALGRLGDERATQPLLTALKDKRFQIRREAAEALGNIRAQAAVAALIAALKDEESSVRSSAACALGQIKDPHAIEALIAASQDKEASASAISALRSITGHPDYTWEQWQRWWKKNRDKWIRSAKEAAGRRVVRETIKDFQIDDRKRKVNWTLRVVTTADYKSSWFLRRGDQEKEEYIGSNIAAMSELYDIKAAPNGRYMAVLSVGEGHPFLEVVDLPLLLKQKGYRVLRTIDPYPGGVGINRWDKDRLIIDSDALLTHIRQNGRVHNSLALMPPQSYALSIESGKVEALSQDAKKPIEYFSRQLFVKYAGERDNAAMALVALKAKSAIPALKKALAAETNPAVRAGMQKAVDELGKVPNARPTTQPVDTESGEGWVTYVDSTKHFSFKYPKTWILTTGHHMLDRYESSFVTLNNLGKENFWLIDKIGEEPEVILSELPRASIYLDIGWFEYPMVDRWQLKKDEAGQDLTSVLKASPEKLLEDFQAYFRNLSFWKWGRCWKINTFIVEPVSDLDKKKLENVLKSFCFDAVPTGDEFWAAGLAREHLWPQASPHEFPLKGSQENNSVHTVKRGDDVLVTFTTTSFKTKEPENVWQFRVTASGEVIPIPGRKNVPLQESPWGREHKGLQCQVLTWTEIEQGMPLNTTVNLRCLPENVEPGVEQLNTFLYDEFLKLRLKNFKTQRVLTVRPYSYSYIGGPPRVDTGQNTSLLNGMPLRPWEVSFPLVRERDALEPGLYECTVEYSFPKEKTQWWHWKKDWESFSFWHGTIISGSFQLKILEEIPKTKQLLVPKRLRYSQEERKVYYTKQDAVKIEVPLRNGFYIGTWIRKGDQGGSLNSGTPVPDNINGIDNCIDLPENKKLSYTIEVFETSDPPCHFWHPGPGSGDYKVLWKKSFEFDVDENTESKK